MIIYQPEIETHIVTSTGALVSVDKINVHNLNNTSLTNEAVDDSHGNNDVIQSVEEATQAQTVIAVEELEPPAKKPRLSQVSNFNLHEALIDNPIGPSIIRYYAKKKELNAQCQAYLCDVIVMHFLKHFDG